jgi:cellulase/cellobiase CelA1
LPVSKHSPAPISPARLVFLAAVTVLVALVVWVAVRAVGPSSDEAAGPTVVLPSAAPTIPVGAAEPESPSPTISLIPASSPSASSPSPSPSRSASRRPNSASPTPRVSRTSAKPAPKATFTATLSTSSSWGGGYVAMVKVTNTGTKAAGWSMNVSHGSVSGLRLYTTWNAQGSQQGSTFAFSGASLAPGQSASFGYQAGAHTHDQVRPSGCSVSSGTCHVS